MVRTILSAAALLAALQAPALAQSGSCATGGPGNGPQVTVIGATTEPLPNSPGRLIQSVTLRNETGAALDVTIQVMSAAFTHVSAPGTSHRIQGGRQMSVPLGVVQAGLTLDAMRQALSLSCSGGGMRPKAAM